MPGYSEQGALFGSLQRIRWEDGAEKIKGLSRASIWAPPIRPLHAQVQQGRLRDQRLFKSSTVGIRLHLCL